MHDSNPLRSYITRHGSIVDRGLLFKKKNQEHDLPTENVVTVQGFYETDNRFVEEDNAEELSLNDMTLKPKRSRKEGRTRLRELRTRRLIAALV
uniref:Uncharacterized protein n=1 Tax=Lactuca sativa TaxID=4236 RepID=A0A9R1WC87_LACSA|nr:hypothetical protein LSAT_V11C200061010 [Lactuca sativa]